jgi:hypothetical protein
MSLIHVDTAFDTNIEPWELPHMQNLPTDANYVEPDMWQPERESPWMIVVYALVIVGTVGALVLMGAT